MSIQVRLALWCAGMIGLILASLSLLSYAIHTRAHYDDIDRVLVQTTDHVAPELQASGGDLPELLRDASAPDLIIRAYDADGRPLDPGGAVSPPVDPRAVLENPSGPPFDWISRLAPSVVDVNQGHGAWGTLSGAAGDRWRVYALHVPEQQMYLVAEAPLGRIDASVARFRRLMTALSLAGVGLTTGVGVLLAHRALRPVAVLTNTAAEIALSREMGRRVPVGNRQDELGQLAATFNSMLSSLETAHRAQQRFVSDASHELRAPLTIIQANLEFVERSTDLPPAERQAALSEAGREVRRLTQLVADLLALARADAGVAIQQQPVELDRVLLDAVGDARHLARGQRLVVARIEAFVVCGDADRLKQLVLILLDNALKYTPDGRTVSVALDRHKGWAALEIRDEGIGIPADDVPHVFERFYRADPARSRDPGGTGLGLPIARWIVEQHGGAITLTSEVGKGTQVLVRLPIDHRAVATA